MPVLSQFTSLLVKLFNVESSVVSNTTGSVLSDGEPDGDVVSKKHSFSYLYVQHTSYIQYLLSHMFSKYVPILSPLSIKGLSAFRYVLGPSGNVL